MRLAPLTDADLEAATDLWTTGWRDAHLGFVPEALARLRTRENFQDRLLTHRAATTLAFEDGRLAGLFILDGCELEQFYVAADLRGAGVAARLMHAAEAALARAGQRRVWLACTVGNTRAARFYGKMAWWNTGPQIYEAFTHDGPVPLAIWRFEKTLTPDP